MKKHVWVCVARSGHLCVTAHRATRAEARELLSSMRASGLKTKNPIKVSLP